MQVTIKDDDDDTHFIYYSRELNHHLGISLETSEYFMTNESVFDLPTLYIPNIKDYCMAKKLKQFRTSIYACCKIEISRPMPPLLL